MHDQDFKNDSVRKDNLSISPYPNISDMISISPSPSRAQNNVTSTNNLPYYGSVSSMLEHQAYLEKKFGPAIMSPRSATMSPGSTPRSDEPDSPAFVESYVMIERDRSEPSTPSKFQMIPPGLILSPVRSSSISPLPKKSVRSRRPHQSPPKPAATVAVATEAYLLLAFCSGMLLEIKLM